MSPLSGKGEPGSETFNLAVFEVHATAPDVPTDRRRWNGDPMSSPEADAALHRAVAAFQESLRRDGFPVARTGYGVRAVEFGDA